MDKSENEECCAQRTVLTDLMLRTHMLASLKYKVKDLMKILVFSATLEFRSCYFYSQKL